MFEPSYDSYAACASMAGAVPRLVRLHPPDWTFDPDELAAAAASPRARLLLLNTPHNPTGKVFSADELGQAAALCRAHDLLAVTDEVYEHLVFDGAHVPLATLPGMRERTLTISSGGKTFSFTGWKVGWGQRPGAARGRRPRRQAVPHLHQPGAPPARHRARPRLRTGARLHALADGARRQARPALRRPGRPRLQVYRPSATYFATTDIAARRARPERARLLPRPAASAAGWSPSRARSSTTRPIPTPGARSSGGPSASRTPCCTTPSPA